MKANDKRRIANERVRTALTDSLLGLLEEKRFSEITVTEIVKNSGVSRQSYYRNFDSKESIIESIFAKIHAEAIERAMERNVDNFGFDLVLSILEVLHKHQSEIIVLNENGFAGTNLAIVNEYLEQALGSMPHDSINRYLLSMLAGSLYSVMLQWLKGGASESCEDMARFICDHCNVGVLTIELDG